MIEVMWINNRPSRVHETLHNVQKRRLLPTSFAVPQLPECAGWDVWAYGGGNENQD